MAHSILKYEEALANYANLDLLISSIYRYQGSGKIDIPSLFGPRFGRLNVFYSSPEYYTKWKHRETLQYAGGDKDLPWSVKNDDFFPYSDCPHCFWTGYFTSRTGFKRLERVGSSFLQAARQIETMKDAENSAGLDGCHCKDPLFRLDDAMGIVQHHDAVSGTAKQHVANDYAMRVQGGIDRAAKSLSTKLKRILLGESNAGQYLEDLSYCQFLNETKCDVSTQEDGKDLYVVVYNGLAKRRSVVVGLPIPTNATDHTAHLNVTVQSPSSEEVVEASVHFKVESAVLYFRTGPLPPAGGSVFKVSFFDRGDAFDSGLDRGSESSLTSRSMLTKHRSGMGIDFDGDIADISNGILSVRFDRCVDLGCILYRFAI